MGGRGVAAIEQGAPSQRGSQGLPRSFAPALLAIPAVAVLVAIYLYPLAGLLEDSLNVNGSFSLEYYRQIFDNSVFVEALRNTLEVSALVTLVCVVLGYPLAYLISRVPGRWATLLLFAVLLPFFSSVLVRSFAWVTVLAEDGPINDVLVGLGIVSEPVELVFNRTGVVIGMAQIQLPLLVLPLYSVLRGIDRSLVMAAQSLGGSPATAFRKVVLPLSLPGLKAGCGLVFIVSLGFFITPALLGGPGDAFVAQIISTRITTLADFSAAAAQSGVLLAAVAIVMVLLRRPLGLATSAGALAGEAPRTPGWMRRGAADGGRRPGRLRERADALAIAVESRLSPYRWYLGSAVAIFALAYLLLPLAILVPVALSPENSMSFPPEGLSTRWFETYFESPDYLRSTVLSLGLAGAGAVLATLLGTLAAYPLVRGQLRGGGAVKGVLLIPLVLPQMVAAVGLFFVVARLQLVDNVLPLLAAYTVLGIPYAVMVMTAALSTFDRTLEQAAASLGASPARTAWYVTLPILRPALATSLVFGFLIAFDDVVFALFLSGPDTTTLPLRLFQDATEELSPLLAAVSVILLVGTVVGLLASVAIRGREGLGRAG